MQDVEEKALARPDADALDVAQRVGLHEVISSRASRVVHDSTPSGRRYVVARYANGGIGDHLSCLIGAWWFAYQTGRHLVIDWRGSRFNSDRSSVKNCFEDFFEASDVLAGVPVVADDRVRELPFSDAAYPPKWDRSKLLATAHVPHTAEEVETVNRLVRTGEDRQEPWVIFNQWIELPPREELRRVLRQLRFIAPIAAAAEHWLNGSVGDRPAVGIHIRHGNGENIGNRAAYWLDPLRFGRQTLMNQRVDMHRRGRHGRFGDNMPDSLIQTDHFSGSEMAFLERVRKRLRLMQNKLGGAAVPVLFCDSPAVVDVAQALMPDVLVPPKTFLPPNAGPLHGLAPPGVAERDRALAGNIAFDMCFEMELMRRCSALICMPSGFSIFARALLEEDRIDMLGPVRANRWIERVLTRVPMSLGSVFR
jgi:Nodulation protein Z (NodZ)